jgi:hypothetical protein
MIELSINYDVNRYHYNNEIKYDERLNLKRGRLCSARHIESTFFGAQVMKR